MNPVSYKTEHVPVKRPGRGRVTTRWLSSELKECFDPSNLCPPHHTHTLTVAVKNTKISLSLHVYFTAPLNNESQMPPKHNPCPTVGYVQLC